MTPAVLRAAVGLTADLAQTWADVLTSAFARCDCTTPRRQAMFIAQYGHETLSFSSLVENLNYSDEMRIWKVFARFDADKDRHPDPEELARCRLLVRQPQALAIAAYGGRLGNEPAPSDDGWRFRGRGLPHLTGRANYIRAGAALNLDLAGRPEQVELPHVAALVGAFYWQGTDGMNAAADRRDVEACTRLLNGGLNGIDDRRSRYQRACLALGVR